jgi:hypothetical protein
MSKLNLNLQDGKPLTAKQSAILENDSRVESYFTEQHDLGGRNIWVYLVPGLNYEGRQSVHGVDWKEIVWNMESIEEGEPDESAE